MPKRGQESADEAVIARVASRRCGRAAERVWFAGLSVLALVVIAFAGITAAAASETTCAWCHSEVAAGRDASAHASLSCETCHAGPGRVDLLASRVSVVGMVAAEIGGGYRLPLAAVDSASCLSCHERDVGRSIEVNGLRMDHRAPVREGWACKTCHPNAGHRTREALVGYTMDLCLGCHSTNPENISTCETCHVGGSGGRAADEVKGVSPWSTTHGEKWRTTHGMGDAKTCGACHPDGYCVHCHGANVPHQRNYLARHGKDVLSRDDGRAACSTCHRDGACDECHGIPMPHPAGFIATHSDVAPDGPDDACVRCHKQESCDACHVRHTHPGLRPETVEALRSRPVKVP